MIKDIEHIRTIAIPESEQMVSPAAADRLIKEVSQRLVQSVCKEIKSYCYYPIYINPSAVDVRVEQERRVDTRENMVRISALLRGGDIEKALADASRKWPIVSSPPAPALVPSMTFNKGHRWDSWDDSPPSPHSNLKTLHAMLDELLPNWRQVYDQLEGGKQLHTFTTDYEAVFAAHYRSGYPKIFTGVDFATGKSEDNAKKD